MRAIAVDFGSKLIGIAVGETSHGVGSPRSPIPASGTLAKDAQAIVALAKKEEAELIVVGLPIEESGNEGKMARICRMLGDRIVESGFQVAYVDESYTSREAESTLAESGVDASRRKTMIHGEAALLILERYSA